ncbi:hypothetical protein [Thermophilibacter sp.]
MSEPERGNELAERDFDEPTLLIKLSDVDDETLRNKYRLYERTRGEWAASLERVRDIRLALAVVGGRVVEVYRVAGWFRSAETMHIDPDFSPASGRVEFVGNLASQELRDRYRGRAAHDLFSGRNPIRYIKS